MGVEDLSNQLAKLPLRALTALVGRCAWRVRPLAGNLPEDSRVAVDRAIAVAEAVARGRETSEADAAIAMKDALAASNASTATPAHLAASAAGWAVAVAGAAEAARAGQAFEVAVDYALAALRASVQASDDAFIEAFVIPHIFVPIDADKIAEFQEPDEPPDEVDDSPGLVESAARADIERLIALSLGEPGTPGTPIDPSESGPLGPLWPHGEPAWLRKAVPATPKPLRVFSLRDEVVPPPASPDLVIVWDPAVLDERRYAQLVALLGDLARAEGGLGIERIRSLGLGVPSGAGVRCE